MSLASIVRQPDGTHFSEISTVLRAVIEGNGFRINSAKMKLAPRTHRQEVTGLIVNKRLNVKRRFIREIRAMLHAWRKYGFAAAQKHFTDEYGGAASNFELAVRGKIGFVGQIRGRSDNIFRGFADQFNLLTRGPKINTTLTPQELAEQAVWVIEHAHEIGQGTAFFLHGYGLITCAHCVDGSSSLYIYHPTNHTKTYQVSVISSDPHRDLAILAIPPELSNISKFSLYQGVAPSKGASVILYGYPAHHAARPIRIEHGEIFRTFPRSCVWYLEISPKVIGGNSGGPVLNEDYEVVGVAVMGLNGKVDLKTTEFLAVSATELIGMAKGV
jgi:S1-C subfamily serine protease